MNSENKTTSVRIIDISKLVLKVGLAALLIYSFMVGLITPTHAQTSTPTQSPTPTTGAESIGDKIKEKIQSLKPETRLGGYVGDVTDKTDSSLTLTTKSGPKQASISKDTIVIKQKSTARQTVKPEDIALNDYIIAMGTIEDPSTRILTAKRILIIDKPKPVEKSAVLGTITEVNSKTLKLEPKNGDWTIDSSSAKVAKMVSGKLSEAKLADIDIQTKLLAIGIITDAKNLQARYLLILNSTTITPSPTPTGTKTTPSPSPKLSPTKTP